MAEIADSMGRYAVLLKIKLGKGKKPKIPLMTYCPEVVDGSNNGFIQTMIIIIWQDRTRVAL
jgi:hypothetical protein